MSRRRLAFSLFTAAALVWPAFGPEPVTASGSGGLGRWALPDVPGGGPPPAAPTTPDPTPARTADAGTILRRIAYREMSAFSVGPDSDGGHPVLSGDGSPCQLI